MEAWTATHGEECAHVRDNNWDGATWMEKIRTETRDGVVWAGMRLRDNI